MRCIRCKTKKQAPVSLRELARFIGLSVGDVRQESDLTGSLYSLGELTLMHCAGAGGAAGQDLAALGHIAAELSGILIVDAGGLVYAKLADFSALAGLGIVLIESHSCILLEGLTLS